MLEELANIVETMREEQEAVQMSMKVTRNKKGRDWEQEATKQESKVSTLEKEQLEEIVNKGQDEKNMGQQQQSADCALLLLLDRFKFGGLTFSPGIDWYYLIPVVGFQNLVFN